MNRHTVGIDDITTDVEDSNAETELFDLQGRRVTVGTPLPGLYIRRTGSKVEKVIIR